MKREIPGIDALAKALPNEWLLYASLNCYPRAQSPMEIDAMIVMDDRVVILELKDWNGKLSQRGDQWFIGGKSRGRSAVVTIQEKARKLKSVLVGEIPNLRQLWVDGRVVLTASATRDGLPAHEKPFVWTLAEACGLGEQNKRALLLPPTKAGFLKAFQFEQEFDRVTHNTRIFQPLEADWAGYRVFEANVVVHPREVWREHRAERHDEPRLKALLRVWSFDRLPPGLNSPDRRRLIANREIKAFAHLTAVGSPLIERNGIFRDIGPSTPEILTNHFELRALPADWTTWDRFLERSQDSLDPTDRVLIGTTLLSAIADLHRSGIAHRDLGPRSVWMGSPTRLAFSGLMCCQLPDEESVEDWLTTLNGYAPAVPEDGPGAIAKSTARERDVFFAARLVVSALGVNDTLAPSTRAQLPPEFELLQDWADKALAPDPKERFPDGVALADRYAELAESFSTTVIDQRLLDRHEKTTIPFVVWPADRFLVREATRSTYESSRPDGQRIVVKVWHGLRRNTNAATDLAIIRLLESATRISAAPAPGLPRYMDAGLSPVGPYVVYHYEPGTGLDMLHDISASQAVDICMKLFSAVNHLHALGCEHGDIAPRNIVFDAPSNSLRLMDAFDISGVGDSVIRTPSYCPTNWERLSQQAIDRFAALKVAHVIIKTAADTRLAPLAVDIEKELARPVIETLEVAFAHLRNAAAAIERPPKRTFKVSHPEAGGSFFQPDEGGYFLTRRTVDRNAIQYAMTGVDRELIFATRDGVLVSSHFIRTSFGGISSASQHGVKVDVDIEVSPGAQDGFVALLDYIKALAEPLADVTSDAKIRPSFDVPRHWDRLLDLETRDRTEVQITAEIGVREGIGVYAFQSAGTVLDFDPESPIDIYLPPNKRVGELEHELSDATNTLAVRNASRKLSRGDTVFLVDRREQTSIDRRSKAVRKILDDGAAIPDLIDYFCPDQKLLPLEYDIPISEETLKAYDLNKGQRKAFEYLLRHGPVGLLQGPPGTGKTRFIASFVHWLMNEGGARRVLIASQSHEAVNNAIENLIDLYKRKGGKPNLLRIGSKGITDKIRPYHSAELRNRYKTRFEAALKYRVTLLALEKGVPKVFTSAVLEVDDKIGLAARLCDRLRRLAQESEATTTAERERYMNELKRAEAAFRRAAERALGIQVDVNKPMQELEGAYRTLLSKHQNVSEADLVVVRRLLDLAHDWLNSMNSIHRNFDEFLAKTRGIITATCVGVGETKIRIDASEFDWVIVDEAARCTSSELAVPIQMGRRILLVGDHLQLIPMIKRHLVDALQLEMPEALRDDLTRSDFERAFLSEYGTAVGRKLTEQYRMHPDICNLVSACFYEPHAVKLTTSPDRKPVLDISADTTAVLQKPICWVDTADAPNSRDTQLPNSTTFHNDAEVQAVVTTLDIIAAQKDLVDELARGHSETPIGVICMYSGQRRKLELAFARHAWQPKFRRLIRLDTVDAYQGKENVIVIVSLVRSNPERDTGHVRSPNRCNVALSRAQERLIIVGSCSMWRTVNPQSPMRRVLSYIDAHPSLATVLPAATLQ